VVPWQKRHPNGMGEQLEMAAPHLLFWVAFAALLYAYFGYPLCLFILARLRRRPPTAHQPEYRPHVTVVVAAWNEDAVIGGRIENILTQEYPADRLDVIVVSDASTDRTNEIVERAARETGRVRLVVTEERRGKSVALNVGVPAASGEVVVLTDANAVFERDAIAKLVGPLSDPGVGAVSGQLRYHAQTGTGETEGFYWRYEQRVKRLESALGSLVGANGSIYAIRRELFRQVGPLDVNDFRIPYEILLQGHAVVLEPRAISYEDPAANLWAEYRRKVRIMSRAIPTMLSLIPATIARGRIVAFWQLISHKLLREVQGIFFGGMLVGALWGALLGSMLLTTMLVLQAALYLMGIMGWRLPSAGVWRPFRLAAHFDMIALASFGALGLWLTGRVTPTWQPGRGGTDG